MKCDIGIHGLTPLNTAKKGVNRVPCSHLKITFPVQNARILRFGSFIFFFRLNIFVKLLKYLKVFFKIHRFKKYLKTSS